MSFASIIARPGQIIVKYPNKILFLLIFTCAMAMILTSRKLAENIRFGLEFRGGYEIYYVVTPSAGKSKVTAEEMLATTRILSARADRIGMSEPEIHIEGENHIRVKLAGLTSATELRSQLSNPAGLPTVLTEKYSQTVGSVLGNTALKETLGAGFIGILCIFFILIALYRGMGVVASFCTLLYLWLLLILFNACHATLSLSAVVAFVLGIGMAGDASIICFERVREYLQRSIPLPQAVREGFKDSFVTIRDANLVTALAMVALYLAGIGPIQGFSLTMLASILISITTNYLFTRFLCTLLADGRPVAARLLMSQRSALENSPKLARNFIGMGRLALFVSALVIASGSIYYRIHGFNLDIDFTAGTALDIELTKTIDQDTATRIINETGVVPATIAIGGNNNQHIAVRFDEVLKPEQLRNIIATFQAKVDEHVEYEENTADPGVAREFAMRAVLAILVACFSIFCYIALRFSPRVALSVLFAIVHDLLMVSALFALFKLEIDVTYIAAMLTVMGYSLNDKIVIFGRIRENLAASSSPQRHDTLGDLINQSIRQTMGRSLYTVLTVVMAAAALFFFACEPLQMFSLAILLGLISGAYSSIFIAPMLWLALHRNDAVQGSDTMIPLLRAGRLRFTIGAIASATVALWFLLPSHAGSHAQPVASPASANAAVQSHPLGDLTPFVKIAGDTLQLVKLGKMEEARSRITDLESAWDQAEERLQPMSPESWASVDKSIDRALAQLRSGKPDPGACIDALKVFIAKAQSISE